MAIPMREMRRPGVTLDDLLEKYGQKEYNETELLLHQVKSDEEYMQLVDNDPGKMDVFSGEYAKSVGTNLSGKFGSMVGDLTGMPAGLLKMLTTNPLTTAKEIGHGMNERYGIGDILTEGDFTKAKRTFANDPFGVALDMPIGGGIVGKLAGKIGKGILKSTSDVVPRGLSGLGGVDIGVMREGSKAALGPDAGIQRGLIHRQGFEEAAKRPAEAIRKLDESASALRSQELHKWEKLGIPHADVTMGLIKPVEKYISEMNESTGRALLASGGSRILPKVLAHLKSTLDKPATVETVRAAREAIDIEFNKIPQSLQKGQTGRAVSTIRRMTDKFIGNLSKELKESDTAFAQSSALSRRFAKRAIGTSDDATLSKLSSMVEEANPGSTRMLKEMERRTNVPLTATATGNAMSTSSPAGLAAQSANMRAMFRLLGGGAVGGAAGAATGAGSTGAGIGALIGALATTKLASPQAIGKLIDSSSSVYTKPRVRGKSIRSAHHGAKDLAGNAFLRMLLRTLKYGSLQNSRNRENR